jgi:hypothetical protein
MSAFATDLRAWLELPPSEVGLAELAAVSAELGRRAAAHIAASDAMDRESAAVYSLSERMENRLERVTDTIRSAFPRVGSLNTAYMANLLQSHTAFGEPTVRIRHLAGASVREFAELSALALEYGVMIEHLEGGVIRVAAGVSLGRDGETTQDVWVEDFGSAPIESLSAGRLVDSATDELARRMPDALRRFLAGIS